MLKITPRRGEKIQQTLRRFRKMLEKEGIIKEMKRKSYYEPPSEERSRIKRKIKREREKELRQEKKSQGLRPK
jgi:small subunit ribosomal protein S21